MLGACVKWPKHHRHTRAFCHVVQDTGVHVVFQFGDAAFALHPNVVVLPASILQGYLDGAKDGTHDMRTVAVAVQRMMAHEMAHLYLRHQVCYTAGPAWLPLVVVPKTVLHSSQCFPLFHLQPEQDRYGLYRVAIAGLAQHLTQRVDGWKEKLFGWAPPPNTATVFYQNAASKTKALQWQHVYEADEAACAVLARLRLPPDQWAVGLRQASAGQLASISGWVADIEKAGQSSEAAAAKVAAVVARMGWPSLAEGLAQLKAALAKNDVQWLQEQHARCRASHQWQLLVDAAGAEDESAVHIVGRTVLFPDLVVGPLACPEPAVLALLTDLVDTQPPTDMRIARIEHLATQLPMMQRITAPPIELGGRFEAGNMARLIADRADAGIKAEAAAQQALRAAQLAAKKEPGLFGAARRVVRRRAAAAHKHTSQQAADTATQPAPQKPAGPAAQPAAAQRTPPE